MPVTGCTKDFWCSASGICPYYIENKECGTCYKFGRCQNCVLRHVEDKPDGCADEAYYLMYGYPEEVV